MIKVSVIVPVYNVEKYIERCLISLVNQTLEEIEIIVVNDGSTDNSQYIIDEYKKKYPKKIRAFIQENGGQGSARNFGLQKAKGEYIGYVDSDDWVERNMFEEMYYCARQNNSDVVICGNNTVSMDNKIVKIEPASIYHDKNLDILFGKMAVWNKLYKKDLLTNNSIEFRSKLWYEDLDFTAKLLFDNVEVSFLDKPLYNYLLRPGSTMNNSNIRKNLDLIAAFNEIIYYFQNKKMYDLVFERLELLCIYHMYICGITRVINTSVKMREKKLVINQFYDYINEKFPNYKKNFYIKYLDRNKKIIYFLLNHKNYRLIKMIFKLKKGA